MTDNYAALLRQTARVYRESLAAPDADDIFSLAYQWQDKKHRHVHDLCNELEQTADRIEKLEKMMAAQGKVSIKLAEYVDELEAALREIVEQERQTAHPVVVHIIAIARKALEEKDE